MQPSCMRISGLPHMQKNQLLQVTNGDPCGLHILHLSYQHWLSLARCRDLQSLVLEEMENLAAEQPVLLSGTK